MWNLRLPQIGDEPELHAGLPAEQIHQLLGQGEFNEKLKHLSKLARDIEDERTTRLSWCHHGLLGEQRDPCGHTEHWCRLCGKGLTSREVARLLNDRRNEEKDA